MGECISGLFAIAGGLKQLIEVTDKHLGAMLAGPRIVRKLVRASKRAFLAVWASFLSIVAWTNMLATFERLAGRSVQNVALTNQRKNCRRYIYTASQKPRRDKMFAKKAPRSCAPAAACWRGFHMSAVHHHSPHARNASAAKLGAICIDIACCVRCCSSPCWCVLTTVPGVLCGRCRVFLQGSYSRRAAFGSC